MKSGIIFETKEMRKGMELDEVCRDGKKKRA